MMNLFKRLSHWVKKQVFPDELIATRQPKDKTPGKHQHTHTCYQEPIDPVLPVPREQISQKGKAAPRHLTPAMESALPPYPVVWVYFVTKKYPAEEAEKFYNVFQVISWKSFGIKRIENWQQLADQWMINLKKSK